jgi:hypothetical protein
MPSEIKSNKISPATGTAFQFGDSGDTFTLPSGVTLDVNGTADLSGATMTGFTIPSGQTLDIASGATIDATGATVTGFGESSYKILKMSFDSSNTTYSTNSGSYTTTDLSISFTPVSASSTLIVWGNLFVGTSNNAHGYAALVIDGGTYQFGRFGGNFQGSDVIPVHYALSSVNTSTKVIDARFTSSSGTTVYFNTGPYGVHGASYLTVMEVIYNSD